MKRDLGFGNSVCVREAFMETVGGHYIFSYNTMMDMDYPVHEGDPELIEITKAVIKRQFNSEYKHIFITNGATGGVVIALRAYKEQGRDCCRIREAPWYARYPGMIEAAGMRRASPFYEKNAVILLDLPSNPIGLLDEIQNNFNYPVILDAVYFNNVYCGKLIRPLPEHDVLVGSYSKLFGINGIRLGWLATNDDLLAERIKSLITAEYCGLSVPSAYLIKECWKRFNWEYFEQMSNIYLNSNREEWSRLEKFFGDTKVPSIGMFYYAPMDKPCKALITKAGIHWTDGKSMGTNDDFGRFNIGQAGTVIRDAVQAVLKADKITRKSNR